jgi:serine phosphatase RsbU (regulator of sigma subunit)/anti-sigma regulatory factor (Ser/Thr protein kinase)
VTAPVVRRLRLPPAQSSPAVARAAVQEAVAAGGLRSIADEALLLTTELVTNGVVHAGTELDLEIVTDASSISVMVLDHRRDPIALSHRGAARTDPQRHLSELEERGRGLLLVDHLASSWGTLHHGTGKGVWFRLVPGPGPGNGESRGVPGMSWLPDTAGLQPQTPPAELAAEHVALLLENDRLRRVDNERRASLTFLAEASELLSQSLDVELTLALVPRIVVPRLGRWCAVHTMGTDGELHLGAAAHADEDLRGDLLDRLGPALAQIREALRIDGGVPLAAPVDGYAVPLVARGQQLGTLTVGRGTTVGWPGPEEAAVIEDIARRAAVAIDNARIHADRREVAHQLQRSLLPPVLPRVGGVEFGAEYVPAGAGGDAGGDFYDVMALSEESWLVVVGDVSGKGVQAAAVTGLIRDVVRVLVRDGRPLPDVLSRLNGTLVERGGGRFCTLAIASVTRGAAGQLDIGLHLAGHDQPILVRADGTAALVGRCGTALGLLDTVASPRAVIPLLQGETLVFYTDGVTERRRGDELFGQPRLCHEAALLAGYPAAAVAARLRATTLGFSPEVPRDDIAIFALRNDGSAESRTGDW